MHQHIDQHLPWGVIEVRRELCATCTTPCAQQHALEHYGRAASACPLTPPRWSYYGRRPKPGGRGLGDAVAAMAQPIARVLDGALGTNIQNCGGCKARREALNRLVPEL